MLKIRLKRCGRKKLPTYKVVLTPSQSKRDGHTIQELGYYDPIKKHLVLEKEQILFRLKQGAQPTKTVKNFLKKKGIY